jgi:ABC-type polysaccharide/polyol phosphate transport system ATPase subunit
MPAIEFDHVTKRYTLTHSASLRELITSLPRALRPAKNGSAGKYFYALNDVSFEVKPGEVLGIIGHNGAGKTTTLKLLSRVIRPTQGHIRVNGRISALIELGAGFHPDLTGRENVYLNGAILGMHKAEIDRKFDSIVAFSEMERFLDMPVKRYSSGMYVRLGFAVAIHVNPEVLLVDEVLAVGDMAFQRKCLDKIREIRAGGATVVFISHHMRTVESLCDRALWLERGRVRQMGDLKPIVAAYTDAMNRSFADGQIHGASPERRGTGEVLFTKVAVCNGQGRETEAFHMGDTLAIEMQYTAKHRIPAPSFDIAIYADNGARVCTATTRYSGVTPAALQGEGTVRAAFPNLPLTPGGYSVTVAIFDHEDLAMYDQWYRARSFIVESQPAANTRWQMEQDEHGVVYLPPQWEFNE